MPQAVFFDPQRKRWKRLRAIFDVVGVSVTLLIAYFVYSVMRDASLPQIVLPDVHRQIKALKEKEKKHAKPVIHHRKSSAPPSEVVLNSGEGIRAAFYVNWDPASYSSLREYVHQIDLLFPEWLHILNPDGHLVGITPENQPFDIIENGHVHSVDDKVMPLLRTENAELEVMPLVNNYNPLEEDWNQDVGKMLNDPAARATFRSQLMTFLGSESRWRGLTLDFEDMPFDAQPGYKVLIKELSEDLHGRGLKLYVSVPPRNEDFDYKLISQYADGLIVMNYDEHYPGGQPGSVAAQEWFTDNLVRALKNIPREKLICAIGNYGYDWTYDPKRKASEGQSARSVSVQEAWLEAQESETHVDYDSDLLNPHFSYLDEHNARHDVWFLDGVTALNEMRAARQVGISTFALWRLGSEDRSLWAVWDQPKDPAAPNKLRTVPPGQDVDHEGNGEILHINQQPKDGVRQITVDPVMGLITAEEFTSLPLPYELFHYGGVPNKIAITFDDGPDPRFTPKMLDVLRDKNVKATFFLIGIQADKYTGLTKRIYREGNEIGNHTFTHPDISSISKQYMKVELNLTERFMASSLGVKPMYFRPPYSVDQDPDTADEVRPLQLAQDMGYVTVGDLLDPNDWKENPHRSAEQIVQSTLDQLAKCKEQQKACNVLLLHDGGGDRTETVRALPMLIDTLRSRGYELVPVSALMGKTRDEVMPPISANERWSARLNRFGFWLYDASRNTIVLIFFLGNILMTARLLFVGIAAIYDRLRTRDVDPAAEGAYKPAVAVLIPAYNEEKVIERTVRAVLASDYPNLRVIVIDDGSKDATLAVTHKAFVHEIEEGKVTVLTKPNSGKADALNYGLENVTEEIFVGIDADTVIAPDAIRRLVPHFLNPKVAAIAGNAKVGNRINLWTRWQALEYITSQNFERRALNTLGAVSVVPGAIGAWRTSAVREAGGYQAFTVAEDADLTMSLLRLGYRVEYEDLALAFTEAPSNANGLMRQRFRWSFGILQSVWKHRAVFARKGVLGLVALPNIVIFQILLPVVSPFIDLMFVIGLISYLVDRSFHPETADPASLEKLVGFFATFLIIDFIASAIAFALERKHESEGGEETWLLAHVWLQRFAYRQLFSVVLFKTLKRAFEGRSFAWDKLERTAAVHYVKAREPAKSSS